jgi:hypothetical protein
MSGQKSSISFFVPAVSLLPETVVYLARLLTLAADRDACSIRVLHEKTFHSCSTLPGVCTSHRLLGSRCSAAAGGNRRARHGLPSTGRLARGGRGLERQGRALQCRHKPTGVRDLPPRHRRRLDRHWPHGHPRRPQVLPSRAEQPQRGSLRHHRLYVAGADGSQPRCIGCTDVVDGRDGVRIFQAEPSAADRPNEPLRKTGFTVYTNQSKDLAAWELRPKVGDGMKG